MNDIAIRVDGLSKQYRLGERQGPYKTMRETLTDTLTAPFRRLRQNSQSAIRNPKSETIWALKDVSFEIKRGEVVGIIGRNGAGKSTLLKILSKITEPTSGSAEIYGRVGSLLEVGTGFHPELTGRENIYLNGAILGMKRIEIEKKFDEIVAFAEIEKFIDTQVKHYSSGMYLRLAFAVAAHLEPEILLVDEVLAVGDIGFQSKCLNKMKHVSETGRTVLFVSHNMGAIHRLCQKCILLDQGKIVLEGPTEDVIQAYISSGLMERSEYIQTHNPEKPMNLRRVCVATHRGEIQSEFRFDQGIRIEIEYEVNRQINNCSIWAGIRNIEEIWVFGTADCDMDGSLLGERKEGYYKTSFEIPAKLLNAGKYNIIVGISKMSPIISYDRVEAVGFTLLDIGTPARISTGQSRPGILQPFLKWNTTKLYDNLEAEICDEKSIG